MTGDLTWLQALVMGAVQGISELFPVSSLGHAVLLPALIGGSWAKQLSVSAPGSPYLTLVVGLHVATALALIVFFRKDWIVIIRGFFTSIRHRSLRTAPERLAWLLIAATIPACIVGVLGQSLFTEVFGVPIVTACVLIVNGFILFAVETFSAGRGGRHAHATAGDAVQTDAPAPDGADDTALARLSFRKAVAIGSAQILALVSGISRSGVVMAAGLSGGLSHRRAARFSFLLATPVILAAGAYKLPSLLTSAHRHLLPEVLGGSAVAFVVALFAMGFLDRYFRTRTLYPFALYCVAAGIFSLLVLILR